jgi:hypothetical protein
LAVDKIAFGHAIGQRPLLLLGTLLIIVGIQLLSLGLLSELIAYRSAREGLETFQVERTVEYQAARADVATRASVLAAEAAATRARAEAEMRAAEVAETWAVDELAAQMKSTEATAQSSAQPAVQVKADAAVEDRQRDDA